MMLMSRVVLRGIVNRLMMSGHMLIHRIVRRKIRLAMHDCVERRKVGSSNPGRDP